MRNIINAFIKSLAGSGSNSQICIGNGNIQCRGSISGGKVIIDGEEINFKDGTWINEEEHTFVKNDLIRKDQEL